MPLKILLCIMLSEIRQKQTKTIRSHLQVESKKKTELIKTENRLEMVKGVRWRKLTKIVQRFRLEL